MTYRRMTIISAAVAVVLAGMAAVTLSRLPVGARLPTHWNLAGEPDDYSGAAIALFLPVLLTLAGALLFGVVLPRIEPMQHRLERSVPLLYTSWAGLLGIMILVEALIAGPSFGVRLPPTLPLAAVGVLMLMIGNVLPKSRPGFFIGIRTPWTLMDEDNWIATHRLGAWTMMAGGALIVAAALLPLAPPLRAAVFVTALVIATVPPIVYSYLYWRRRVGA